MVSLHPYTAASGADKAGLGNALNFVLRSPQVSCLAVMAVAQGLSSILFQVAWKGQLRILHPTPSGYSAFMVGAEEVQADPGLKAPSAFNL